MNALTKSHREFLNELLQDPVEAAAYINAAIEDEDEQVLLLVLRDVIEARGVSKTARDAGLNREGLYTMLSQEGNPRLSSLVSLLRILGLRLAVDVQKTADSTSREEEPSKEKSVQVSISATESASAGAIRVRPSAFTPGRGDSSPVRSQQERPNAELAAAA